MLGGPWPHRLLRRGWLLLTYVRDVFDRRRGVTVGPFTVQALHGLLLAASLSHGLFVEALGLLFLPTAAPPAPGGLVPRWSRSSPPGRGATDLWGPAG